jgi:zinc D-Ala-D-Ala carboxypeptidase
VPARIKGVSRRRHRRRQDISAPIILVAIFLLVLGLSLLGLQYESIGSTLQPLVLPGTPSQDGAVEVGKVPADSAVASDGSEATQEEREMTLSLQASAESCDDMRVLVDRSHLLPPAYAPKDLVSLQSYGVPALGSSEMKLRREAAEHLKNLVSAAAVDGEELVVASAYRSYEDQQTSHDKLSSVYGPGADLMSARPGHSQHQLGTAVDFTNAMASYQVWEPFGYTGAAQWLSKHAHEYGFVLAYPSGYEAETGYEWEPWHYRYVGIGNAEYLAESELSLQEFLVGEGVVPNC